MDNKLNAMFTSGNNEYCTPKCVLDRFGPFDLDLCCNPQNKVCLTGCYCMEELDYTVNYGRVWCNPPYSTHLQNVAVEICIELAKHGNEVYLLIPCRMNSKRFKRIIDSGCCFCVYFPTKRLHFNGIGSAPFDTMIVKLTKDTVSVPLIFYVDL